MIILVPTDFSELAGRALKYAMDVAHHSGASIHLHSNAIHEGPPMASVLIDLNEKVAQQARFELNRIAKEARASCNDEINITWEVSSYHDNAKAIHHVTESSGASLIIMGTRGKSDLAGKLLGQVAYNTLLNSDVPVIVVPPDAKFDGKGAALYAIDKNSPPGPVTLNSLNKVTKLMKYDLELLFVDAEGQEESMHSISKDIESRCENTSVTAYFESRSDIADAIEEFLKNHDSKMLVLTPGHHSFFERLIGKSITKKLLHEVNIPVLALPGGNGN